VHFFLQLIQGVHRRLQRVQKLPRLRKTLLVYRRCQGAPVVAGVVANVGRKGS
jgi:hypothetical protein